MCSGRVAEKFVLSAFENGAAAVLVSGCHIGDCHYIDANTYTEKRVKKLWKLLEEEGIDKNRLQLAWVSAAEGEKFASKIREMASIVDDVSQEEIAKTVQWLAERRKKKEEKAKAKAEKKAQKKLEKDKTEKTDKES